MNIAVAPLMLVPTLLAIPTATVRRQGPQRQRQCDIGSGWHGP